jgi:uncharacterized protein
MSAAVQKTQEPSMEEILASIRRIIADDQDPAAATPEQPDFSAQEAPDDVLDLATLPQEALEESFVDDLEIVDLDGPDVEEMEEGDLASMASAFDSLRPADPDPFADESEFEEPLLPPVPSKKPFRDSLESEKSGHAGFGRDSAGQEGFADAIMSHSTNTAVSQAFNTLAHTVLTNNARTLEDLVREMMRPMLKVWLDDNLPSLVERLVRSEIERVARGR